jgi:uncharacterized ubiquitin-like protein YukD|tara:strand:- start:1617 stop:2039 length:423 start_codon:yes stop_codon:yes gene_type:complete
MSSFCQKTVDDLNYFGKKIDLKGIEDYKLNKNKLLNNPNKNIKIEGKITSTCPEKGCWMKVNINKDTLLVRFKDYGFFVPKMGSEDKSVVVNGKISIDTLSINQLKHFAEDAGMTMAEISLITKPKITISFLADGVIIKN